MQNFDELSKTFDKPYRIERAAAIASEIKRHISPTSQTAMEFGSGTGLVGVQLADQFNHITFVDTSTGMTEAINDKCTLLGIKNAKVLCCDILEEVFTERFDCIFSSMVLHHIMNTEEILARLYELISDGGQLLIVDLDTDDGGFHSNHEGFAGHDGFDQNNFTEITQKVGFKNVTIQTFYNNTETHDGTKHAYSLFIMKAER